MQSVIHSHKQEIHLCIYLQVVGCRKVEASKSIGWCMKFGDSINRMRRPIQVGCRKIEASSIDGGEQENQRRLYKKTTACGT